MSESGPRLERRARALLAHGVETAADESVDNPELRRAIHELRVHEIELELQNEELQRVQTRLESSRAALAASEARYRNLFERAPTGYLTLDKRGAILEANYTVSELLGADRTALTRHNFRDFITPQRQDAYYIYWQSLLRGERPDALQVELRGLDGNVRDAEITGTGPRDLSEEIRVAIVDVTTRKRDEAEQRESERQRRLLADSLPLAVAVVDADGSNRFCNREFLAFYGTSAEAVEGQPFFETLGPDIYAAWREPMREALAGRVGRFEGELRFPATGARQVCALFAPDETADVAARGFVVLVDDRTGLADERRGMREAASQVALAEERERRALASDLHDDAGQLLSLAYIKLRTLGEQLAETEPQDAVHEIAGLVREARESISSLSFELSPPLLYDVGFVSAVDWLTENLRGRYGLETELQTVGQVPGLDEATAVTLFRALRELLINVAKHAGTNRALVTIRGSEDEVSVTVRDDGIGFDRAPRNEGFGLWNVLDRIESLGGRVIIDSEADRGTQVSLSVPIGRGSSS